MRCTLPIVAVAVLAAACSDASIPLTEPYSGAPRPFARFVERGDGGALEVLVSSYRKGDANVTLLAAIHVGDREYYTELQRRFGAFDALLFEMIGDADLRPHPDMELADGDWINMVQAGMGRGFSLARQWDCIDYRQPNFVHADMTWQEWEAELARAGTSEFGELMSHGMQESDREAEAKQPRLDLVAAFRAGRGAHEMRILGARILTQETAPARTPTVLIEGRNEKCLMVLRQQLLDGVKSIGVFYGADHMAHLEQRLVRDHGFAKVSEEWIVAWDCSASRFPVAEKGLKQKRYRARRDLAKLSAAASAWCAANPGVEPTWEKIRAAQPGGRLPGRSDGVDPWGRAYVLRQVDGSYEARCAGSDGAIDTDDDIDSR